MAERGLMDIIKDPNYVSANEETKKAIFEKFSAKDPNYTNANDETKSAIRKRFGVETTAKAKEEPYGGLKQVAVPEAGPRAGFARRAAEAIGQGPIEQEAKVPREVSEQYKQLFKGLPIGAASSLATGFGIPALGESLVRAGARKAGADVSTETFLPTPERAGTYIFGKPKSEYEAAARYVGELATPVKVGKATLAEEVVAPAAKESAFVLRPEKQLEKVMKPATSVSEVGQKLEAKLSDRLEKLIETRSKDFETVKDAYLDAGRAKEGQIRSDYMNALSEYYAKNGSKLTDDERVLMEKLFNRMAPRAAELGAKEGAQIEKGFEAIEKERRYLDDVASGFVKPQGAEAIRAEFAREMSNLLEGVIKTRIPEQFNLFNKTYTELSAPINRYNTAIGQAVTKKAGEYLPEVSKIDPSKIPSKFFDSRRSVNELRALAGDEKFVQDVAREHIATDLRNVKDAKEIRDYVSKNYDWLQELPQIRQELESLAKGTARGELAKTLAKWGGVAALGAPAVSKITKIFGD